MVKHQLLNHYNERRVHVARRSLPHPRHNLCIPRHYRTGTEQCSRSIRRRVCFCEFSAHGKKVQRVKSHKPSDGAVVFLPQLLRCPAIARLVTSNTLHTPKLVRTHLSCYRFAGCTAHSANSARDWMIIPHSAEQAALCPNQSSSAMLSSSVSCLTNVESGEAWCNTDSCQRHVYAVPDTVHCSLASVVCKKKWQCTSCRSLLLACVYVQRHTPVV